MLGSILSSSRSALSAEQALDLANADLKSARNTQDIHLASIFCDDAEISLFQAKQAFKKARSPETLADQMLRPNIGTAYFERGKILDQFDAVAIRQVVNKFSQEVDYKAGFHHVLTEIAFLQIREKHMIGEHGIIPVSLTPNSYEECLAHFIPATTVRMEDIPRLEGQAQAGREVHQNQSRHGVLFKKRAVRITDSEIKG